MSDEKTILRVSGPWENKAMPVEWEILPKDIQEKTIDYVYMSAKYHRKEIKTTEVVYFKKVKKLLKRGTSIEKDDIIFEFDYDIS